MPDCHSVRTAIPAPSLILRKTARAFSAPVRPLLKPLLQTGFQEAIAANIPARISPAPIPRSRSIHSRQATTAHSVTAFFIKTDAPHCRFTIRFIRESGYRAGSTFAHKNGSPREQGRHGHAIDRRPEPASVYRHKRKRRLFLSIHAIFTRFSRDSIKSRRLADADTLSPSPRPKLGVTSGRQRFHRYALQRIFRPSLGSGGSDRDAAPPFSVFYHSIFFMNIQARSRKYTKYTRIYAPVFQSRVHDFFMISFREF